MLTTLLLSANLLLSATAQAAEPATPTVPAEAVAPTPPVAPAPPPAPPAPVAPVAIAAPAAPAAPAAEPKKPTELVKFYGHFQGTVIGAKNGLESFNSANMSAPTAAANPTAYYKSGNDQAASFQAVQSRVGLKVNEGGSADAHLEIDFVDFNKSSPTTQAVPRLRIAAVGWNVNDTQRLVMGQTWDLFGGNTNPSHYNWVGAHFRAGNVGFIRHQVQYLITLPTLEMGLAAGLSNANATSDVGAVEGGVYPTIAGRIGHKCKMAKFGLSGIFAKPKYPITATATTAFPTERRTSYGALAYYDLKLAGGMLGLSGEIYYGHNLADIGALTLSEGRTGKSINEAGGWVQATATFDAHRLYLAAGVARVLNGDDVLPGFTGTPAARKFIGIKSNIHVRPGYAYTPVERFTLFVEPILYQTTHQLQIATATVPMSDETRLAWGAQVGTAFKF